MKDNTTPILFDPVQYVEFGEHFYQAPQFSFRFQESRKAFWKARYIPLGPQCTSLEDLENFLSFVSNLKFCRTKVDLPLVLHDDTREKVCVLFEKYGFKRSEYVYDEETLLVTKQSQGLNSRNLRYVRQGLRDYDVAVKTEFSDSELQRIHDIYVDNAGRIGFKPKSIDAFRKIMEKSITSVAYDRESGVIEGFLMGYKVQSAIKSGQFSIEKDFAEILQLIFTGISEKGREAKLGFALHHELFTRSFAEFGIDIVDFHGASRTKGRSYVGFKQMFSDEFVRYPGSFEKTRFL